MDTGRWAVKHYGSNDTTPIGTRLTGQVGAVHYTSTKVELSEFSLHHPQQLSCLP